MVTNDERREVAARLRENRETQEDIENIWGVLDNILGTGEGSKEHPWDATFDILADLIEPPGRCPHYHSGRHYCSVHKGMALVDRDALLDIADEMERRAGLPDVTLSGQDFVFSKFLLCYAERIRAALGVGK